MGELKTRLAAKKKALEAKLLEAKADAQGVKDEVVKRVKARLEALEDCLEDGWESVEEKWDDLGDAVKDRLRKWLEAGENKGDKDKPSA